MYAVIFRAKTAIQDEVYTETVTRMRELAFARYGCLDFVCVTEGKNEVAISYWDSEEDIKRWKQDVDHTLAQELGRARWYQSYLVQVCEVKRQYGHNT